MFAAVGWQTHSRHSKGEDRKIKVDPLAERDGASQRQTANWERDDARLESGILFFIFYLFIQAVNFLIPSLYIFFFYCRSVLVPTLPPLVVL